VEEATIMEAVVAIKAEEVAAVVAAVALVTKAAILAAVVVEMKVATKARLRQSQLLLQGRQNRQGRLGHLNHVHQVQRIVNLQNRQGRQSHHVQRVHLTAPHLHLHVIQLQIAAVHLETVPKTLMIQNATLIVPKTLMIHDVYHIHRPD
jgi:hypothetical protein